MTVSRRKFLKTLSASCLAVTANSAVAQGFSLPGRMSPGPRELKSKRWAMLVDMSKCDGKCTEDCIGVCHEIHNVPYVPTMEHQVMWMFQEPYENTFPDRSRELISKSLKNRRFLLLCNHCDDPPCVRACPTQATFKRKNDGIVMIDYHRCIGCRFCMAACPYGSRSFNFRNPRPYIKKIHPEFPTRRKGVVEKCNFCQERLEVGKKPACVKTCKKGALVFGDLGNPSSEIRRILDEKHHARRKPELGTRPSVFYIFQRSVMIEKALHGGKGYWAWIIILAAGIALGLFTYLYQLGEGLWLTGMSRNVSWGFYISQFTFLVGVAASVLMVVLPLYLHDFKAFAPITALAQFLTVGALIMSLLFIFSDVGMPMRILNVPLNPTPGSMLFYDTIFLPGFMLLNLVIGWTAVGAEKRHAPLPAWVKFLIYVSFPWAVIMHTVTAFIYAGTPGRGFWMTAIMAPRFLTTAFAAGCAILILLSLLLRSLARFDAGERAIQKLATIMFYTLIIDAFFLAVEYFTAFYSHVPSYTATFRYLFFGIDGNTAFVPWFWCMNLAILTAIGLLAIPGARTSHFRLATACIIALVGLWIDKGFLLVPAAFIPNVFGRIMEYPPSWVELTISLGIYCLGMLVITAFYKITMAIKGETVIPRQTIR